MFLLTLDLIENYMEPNVSGPKYLIQFNFKLLHIYETVWAKNDLREKLLSRNLNTITSTDQGKDSPFLCIAPLVLFGLVFTFFLLSFILSLLN